MIKKVYILSYLLLGIVINASAQDVLVDKENNEYKIVYNKKEGKKIYYIDYDDPDFKQVEANKKDFKKVVLANKKTIWFTMSDTYYRFRLGLNMGGAVPIGNFADGTSTNEFSGYAGNAAFASLSLEKKIYKMIDLKGFVYMTRHIDLPYNVEWESIGYAIGPQLRINYGARFFSTIPFLYHRTEIDTYTSDNISELKGIGIGNGFVTGGSINYRIGQHFSLGYLLNINYQSTTMRYNEVTYSINNTNTYEKKYNWMYLTGAWSFTIHF